ncbi:MAG: InlB B-repeat-containing protein [Bacillota bacterium]|nr:InlB B-repeat-containing protein [Bacillota bacterium]
MKSRLRKATACFLVLVLLCSCLTVHGAGRQVRALENSHLNDEPAESVNPDESVNLDVSEAETQEEAESDTVPEDVPDDPAAQETTEGELSEQPEDPLDTGTSGSTESGDVPGNEPLADDDAQSAPPAEEAAAPEDTGSESASESSVENDATVAEDPLDAAQTPDTQMGMQAIGVVTITFEPDGGTWDPGFEPVMACQRGSNIVLPDKTVAHKDGFVLVAWRDSTSDEEHQPGALITAIDYVTFTAVWAELVTITFDPAGGVWGPEYGDPEIKVEIGTEYQLPNGFATSRVGYALYCWKDTDNREYQPSTRLVANRNMTFTAVWTKFLTISYDPAGGEWIPEYDNQPDKALPGEWCILPGYVVTKEGYALGGWRDASNREYPPGRHIIVMEDAVFTAVWTAPLTVNFDAAGGDWDAEYAHFAEPQIWAPGQIQNLPREGTLTRAGYLLSGWKDSANEKYRPGEWVTMTESTTYTAIWAEPVNVSLDLAGGEWFSEDWETESIPGEELKLPGRYDVSKTGFELSGWRSAADIRYLPYESIVVTGDMTLTAIWEEPVTISFDTAGGWWDPYYGDQTMEYSPWTEYLLPKRDTIIRDGFRLRAWRDAAGTEHEPNDWVLVTQDVTFTAVWAEPIVISFDLAGGEWNPDAGDHELYLVLGEEHWLPGYYISKMGQRLLGWKDALNRAYEPDELIVATEDMTFTAVWADPLTVTLDPAGGEFEYGPYFRMSVVAKGSTFLLPDRFFVFKRGWMLGGWRDSSGKEYEPGEEPVVNEDMTFTAIWVEPAGILLNPAGGLFIGYMYNYYQEWSKGSRYTLPDRHQIEKPNLVLAGWRDAAGRIHEPGEVIVVTDNNMAFTAVWAEEISVTFNPAGGTWTDDVPPQTWSKGSKYPLPNRDAIHKDGYLLGGWKDDADKLYAPGTAVAVNANVTFTAVWITEGLRVAVFRTGWLNVYELGDTINLAARGEGGIEPYKYQFYVLRSNGARVNFRRTPVSSNIYPWTPVTPDTYTLGVDVYDATGQKVTKEKTITVKAPEAPPLSIAVFRAGWSDTYELGDTIDLAARGEGGTAPYKYQFYVLRSNGARVNFRRSPVSSNIYPWIPVNADKYTLGVDVYDATGKKVTQEKTITVKPGSFEIAVFRAGWSDTYTLGQTINLAARGEGGTAPYRYQFYVLRSNGARANFRRTPVYANVYPWTPVTPDTYTLCVDVYDATGRMLTATKTITVLPKP